MAENLTPAVLCSTGPFWALDLEDAMDAIAEAGYSQIELMVTRDPKTQEPDLPLRLAAERDLRIAAVHGPFLVVTKTVWGTDPLEKIRRGVDMCRAFGAGTLIVHPPYLWERDYARWVHDEAGALAAELGVTVAVETMFPRWIAGRRLRVHRWVEPTELLEACDAVVLDTSHVTVARRDVLECFDLLLPKLVHIHLSNNNGDGRDGHLELERGILPIERILDRIRRARYAGAVSLELNVNAYLDRFEDLVAMLRRNRELMERHLHKRRVAKGLPRTAREEAPQRR